MYPYQNMQCSNRTVKPPSAFEIRFFWLSTTVTSNSFFFPLNEFREILKLVTVRFDNFLYNPDLLLNWLIIAT